MRLARRLIAVTILVALTTPLAGCGGGGLSNLDPTDLFDFLDTKKKLPGERKPVFPEGVPGLQPGVPKELYRGASAEPAPEIAPPPPAAEPKSKRGSQPRPTAKRAPAPAATPADPDAAPAEETATPAAPPAPKGQKITRRRTTAPPPDQAAPADAAPAQPSQPVQSAFPAPLPSNGFSR